MSSLCAQTEQYWQRNISQRPDKHPAFRPAILIHNAEHAWRCRGELDIKEEMERRVAAWDLRHPTLV